MNYPKMLYRKGFDDWKIAADEEAEDALIEKGYMTHAELIKQDANGDGLKDIDKMSKTEIMAELDEREADYSSRTGQDKLAILLLELREADSE